MQTPARNCGLPVAPFTRIWMLLTCHMPWDWSVWMGNMGMEPSLPRWTRPACPWWSVAEPLICSTIVPLQEVLERPPASVMTLADSGRVYDLFDRVVPDPRHPSCHDAIGLSAASQRRSVRPLPLGR